MDYAQKLQLVFQTLGDANRLRIIQFIGVKECTVSEIVQASNLSQPLVSHHLRVLRENQVLDSERKGPFVIYRLHDPKLLEALELFQLIFKDLNINNENEPKFTCGPRWKPDKK
ncbi:MAG TPA: metalloregulator ArsR/SmtB family transcription factor [Bacillota bacterium]|nr:metalloregulator ArsR/SmtB family transcription factor [Bacillota bacterium]